jgi:O-antigen/teichoic acid export membrane protein
MLLLGGPNWRDAGVILRALAPLLLVQGLLNLTGSIFAARGQGRRLLAGSLVYMLLLVQGLIAGWLATRFFPSAASEDGPQQAALWMAAAYTLVMIGVIFLPYMSYCLRSAGVPLLSALLPLWPALRSAAVMGAVVWVAGQLMEALAVPLDYRLELAALLVVGICSFALLAWREVRWLVAELRAGVSAKPESR